MMFILIHIEEFECVAQTLNLAKRKSPDIANVGEEAQKELDVSVHSSEQKSGQGCFVGKVTPKGNSISPEENFCERFSAKSRRCSGYCGSSGVFEQLLMLKFIAVKVRKDERLASILDRSAENRKRS